MNVVRDRNTRPALAVQRLLDRTGGGRRRLRAAGNDRRRRTAPLALPVALLVAGALAGCSQPTPAPAASTPASPATPVVAASATPSASAIAPLTCDDLVPKAQIVSALSGGESADDWVVLPTSTAAGLVTGELAVVGAGGLSCSWSAGPPASEATSAVLTVAVLPDAAKDWTAQLYGDGPTPYRRTFAGVSAAASCGDPGCGASAKVGSSWVRVDLTTGSREGGDTVFAKETDDEVFAALKPAVESAFRAVQSASADQLRFPDHLDGSGQTDCRSYLTKADLAGALGLKSVSLDTRYQITPEGWSIVGAAEQRIGTSVCAVTGHATSNDYEAAGVTVEPGQAWAVGELASNDAARGTYRVMTLKGQVSGEQAVTDCTASSNICTVVFSLGSAAIQVDETPRAVQVAEAIIAAAR